MINELNFIDSTKNDKLSYLRGLDLQELIVQIENFYLTYRETLNFPNNATFGLELEYEHVSRISTDVFIKKNFKNWISKGDGSLDSGGEINSPILLDEINRWEELKEICEYLKSKNALTTRNAAGHIHVGAHILGNDYIKWIKFLKIYTAYEHVLFRFLFGDKINLRRKGLYYAHPIADELYSIIKKIKNFDKLINLLPKSKYQAINFDNVKFSDILNQNIKNTLEYRGPNASSEEVIWQNNVNALTKLTLSHSSNTFDEEFLDFKLKYERISSKRNIHLYNQVCLKNALEFCDLIFDNNLDKVYFLRQYIKGFQETFQKGKTLKAKSFIK